MMRSAWRLVAGALFLLLGFLVLLNALFSGRTLGGSGGIGLFVAGLIPILLGIGLAASGMPGLRSSEPGDREKGSLDRLKDEVRWRALARGGRISADEVAADGGHALPDVERALIAMMAEGLASAEADGSGGIVYHIKSPETTPN